MMSRDFIKTSMQKLALPLCVCLSFSAMAFDDPTRPPTFRPITSEAEEQSGSSFRLSSILISPLRSVAIINGRAVQLGDWLGNFQVHSIDVNSVTLTEDRKYLTLRLLSSSVKAAHEKE